jgi:hypothetical protein
MAWCSIFEERCEWGEDCHCRLQNFCIKRERQLTSFGGFSLTKLFEVKVSLEGVFALVEAQDEEEARSKAEDVILKAMEMGEFEIEVEEVG